MNRMNRETILKTALDIVTNGREETHGKPEDTFRKIAALWSTYLGLEITPANVAIMMVLLKVARQSAHDDVEDNYIDIAGYAACAAEIAHPDPRTFSREESV